MNAFARLLGAAIAVVCLTACASTSTESSAPDGYDMIIRNGRIVDGTGTPWYYGDVGIRSDRIAAVGDLSGESAPKELDAEGLVIAPGFIDVHSHADDAVLEVPTADNFIRNGVTTIVNGNCGSSVEDVGGFFAAMEEQGGTGPNVATLYGHNTILRAIKGRVRRDLTPEELDTAKAMMDEAMREGAVGMSTGLIYVPGTWSDINEIIAIQQVAGKHGGIYASHMRNEGQEIIAAIEEALTVGRESGSRIQISHFKMPRDGVAMMGGSDVSLGKVYEARNAGQEVWLDQYPYSASSTSMSVLFIDWLLEDGPEKAREMLQDADTVRRLKDEMYAHHHEKRLRPDMSFAVVTAARGYPEFGGYNIVEVAQIFKLREMHGDDFDHESLPRSEWPEVSWDEQFDALIELYLSGGAGGVFHTMPEEEVRNIMRSPLVSVAADSGLRRFGQGVPHPRGYGTNARVLGHYVREEGVLSLEEAVRKMTSMPAKAFRFDDRGLLKPGYAADLVVFDPETIRDNATFEAPHAYSTGFVLVMVNGTPVVMNDQVTGATPGRPLYGPGIAAK